MIIRQASVEELKKLWHYSGSQTYHYFVNGMNNGNIEFWTIDLEGALIAELYIIWDSLDKDEANGIDRAYLCALSVGSEHQGRGYSSQLIETVKNRIKDKGFKQITFGIDNRSYEKLHPMYNNWGFTQFIKKQFTDNHYFDKDNRAVTYDQAFDVYMMTI